MSGTQAEARKWRRRGACCIAFGILLEAFAGADTVWATLTAHLSWATSVNLITVIGGVVCINRGLTIRHSWLWALSRHQAP